MNEDMELGPSALCFAVHTALEFECPVCGAEPEQCCTDEGEEIPPWGAHIGRTTGGTALKVEPTGEFDDDGGAILRVVDN
jgi:hypothetical protein